MYLLTITIAVAFGALSLGPRLGVRLKLEPRTPQGSGEVAEPVKSAEEAINAGRIEEARAWLKRALSIEPKDAPANLLMAVVCEKSEQHDDALKFVARALKKNRDHAEAHYLRAVLQSNRFQSDEALREVETAVSLGEQEPGAFELRGDLQLSRGEFESAADSFREAVGRYGTGVPAQLREKLSAVESSLSIRSQKDANHKMPSPLTYARPKYTHQALQKGLEGIVRLLALVDESGSVVRTIRFSTIGYGLDEEAVKAAFGLRFSPAMVDGKAVSAWVPLMIEFRVKAMN
jgi:TonB family protein